MLVHPCLYARKLLQCWYRIDKCSSWLERKYLVQWAMRACWSKHYWTCRSVPRSVQTCNDSPADLVVWTCRRHWKENERYQVQWNHDIYIYIYPVSLSCPLLFHVAQGTASIHVAPTLSGDDLILFGGWIVNCSHDPPPTQGNFVAVITRSHEKLRNSWPWFLTLLQSVIPPQYDNNETVYLISFPLFPLSFFLLWRTHTPLIIWHCIHH